MTQTQKQTSVEEAESPESYKQQHAKVLRFEISIGKDDDDRTIEQFENDIRAALFRISGNPIHNVTVQGGYYLIDGKVCVTQDYDPATKNRKPDTYPPVWAGGPDPKQKSQLIPSRGTVDDESDEDEPPAATIRDIYPEGYKKPERNEFGRRVRSDKGVKRGPRSTEGADKLDMKSKVAELGQQMKEARSG